MGFRLWGEWGSGFGIRAWSVEFWVLDIGIMQGVECSVQGGAFWG